MASILQKPDKEGQIKDLKLSTHRGALHSAVERQKSASRSSQAVQTVRAFHDKLCRTRILDPACGTGNFLYVSLELMKRLEGEVLETLASLGGQEALTGLPGAPVSPVRRTRQASSANAPRRTLRGHRLALRNPG